MTRDDLIAILAAVDGNETSAPNLLDHLYGKQADAILAAGWRDAQSRFSRERDQARTQLRSGAGDYLARKAASSARLGAVAAQESMSIEEWERKHYPRPQQPPPPPISEASDDQILAFYRTVVARSECDHGQSWTGVDDTPLDAPVKAWRCDDCGHEEDHSR